MYPSLELKHARLLAMVAKVRVASPLVFVSSSTVPIKFQHEWVAGAVEEEEVVVEEEEGGNVRSTQIARTLAKLVALQVVDCR